MISFMG